LKKNVAQNFSEKPTGYAKTAEVFGITHQQLDRWVIAGCPREPDGRFIPAKVREWLVQREKDKQELARVRLQKAKADLRDKRKVTQERRQRMRIKSGELHDGKQCDASLGEVLMTIWAEVEAMPDQGQAAFPEIPNLATVLREIVNKSAVKLEAYAKLHAGITFKSIKSSDPAS